MKPVGHHQPHLTLARGLDHALAFLDRNRHRLLAQHVHAGAGGSNRVFRVHRVRQRDVDCIDVLEAFIELLVTEGLRDAVLLAEHRQLLGIAADDRAQGGILVGMRERRQDGHLRDVPQADHAVAYGISTVVHLLPHIELLCRVASSLRISFSVFRCWLCRVDGTR
jgi:hypothetical protein